MTSPCPVRSVLPIVTTDALAATRAFWCDLLGFEVAYDSPFYLGVRSGGAAGELGFCTVDADTPHAFAGAGLAIVCTVASADRELERLTAAGAHVVEPIADKPWGARCFALRDPNGIAVWISHAIAPAVAPADHAR